MIVSAYKMVVALHINLCSRIVCSHVAVGGKPHVARSPQLAFDHDTVLVLLDLSKTPLHVSDFKD